MEIFRSWNEWKGKKVGHFFPRNTAGKTTTKMQWWLRISARLMRHNNALQIISLSPFVSSDETHQCLREWMTQKDQCPREWMIQKVLWGHMLVGPIIHKIGQCKNFQEKSHLPNWRLIRAATLPLGWHRLCLPGTRTRSFHQVGSTLVCS